MTGMGKLTRMSIILLAAVLCVPAGSAVASSASMDRWFGRDGVVSLDVTKDVGGLVERPDGSIVVGSAMRGDSYNELVDGHRMEAHVISRDGTELPGSPVGVRARNSNAEGIGIAKDGSFYLAGWASRRPLNPWRDLGSFSPVVGAFDAEGRSLASFGREGRFAGSWGSNFQVEAIRVQSNGKVLLAGARRGKRQALVVKRLTKDGRLDRSFSKDGSVSLASRWGNMDGFVDIELTRNGRFLAFGFRGGKIVIARFKANGTLDRRFGKRGLATRKVAKDLGCSIMHGCWDSDMTVSRRGAITAMSYGLGRDGRYAVELPILHRFSASGKLKKSWTLPKVGGRRLKFANDLLQQRDGKLVLIGVVGKPTQTVTAVVRLDKDGKPDRTFGTQGIQVLPQIGDPGAGVITSDGKIVIAGREKLTGPASPLVLVRLEG